MTHNSLLIFFFNISLNFRKFLFQKFSINLQLLKFSSAFPVYLGFPGKSPSVSSVVSSVMSSSMSSGFLQGSSISNRSIILFRFTSIFWPHQFLPHFFFFSLARQVPYHNPTQINIFKKFSIIDKLIIFIYINLYNFSFR